MSDVSHIAVAHGNGTGPEIRNACLPIIKEAGARLALHQPGDTLAQGQ